MNRSYFAKIANNYNIATENTVRKAIRTEGGEKL